MDFSRDKLEKMYMSGLSMYEISKQLQCSIHKVSYWMSQYGIKRRSLSEALYIKLNPQGDPFKIKTRLTPEESFFKGLGLGIYWGEGNKATPHSIRVANTDIYMIRSFITFLIVVCDVKKEKLKYSLVCFNDTDPVKAASYWSGALEVPVAKFGKIVQIPSQGKGNYRRKSLYGVCTVSFHNLKLKQWLMDELKNVAGMA